MNIVVSNVKGGVGKTTTSVYLAAAAAERGWDPVILVDADRQASSAEWLEERPVEGVELVEAPSERTVSKALAGGEGLAVVDTPPGDERIVRAAMDRADAVVVPTRAGGVEYSRVLATLEMIGGRTPHGLVICAARLGTNDLTEAIAWWSESKVPIWGIIPERVGIASGPEARLYREGLDAYGAVLKKAVRKRGGLIRRSSGRFTRRGRRARWARRPHAPPARPGARFREPARGSRPARRRRRPRRGGRAAS